MLTNLSWNKCNGNTDHEDHKKLAQPDVGGYVSIAHSRKRNYGEVQ